MPSKTITSFMPHVNPMSVHSVGDCVLMIGRADAPNEGDAEAAARRIIGELHGYTGRSASKRERDILELANAMQAYAALFIHYGPCAFSPDVRDALEALDAAARARAERRQADRVDGYDRDDIGESHD